MKIALITHYWKNSDGGGIKTYTVNLFDMLRKKGVCVKVLYRFGDDPEQFDGGRNKLTFPFTCYRQLRKLRPNVIHSHGTWYCLLPGVIYKILHGCTLIHTFHSEPVIRLSFLSKFFFQGLLNNCDCVTFVSKGLHERVIEVDNLSFTRTAIILGGARSGPVTHDEVRQFREQFRVNHVSPVLLVQAFTATSLKCQGLKLVIRSLKFLRKSHPNIVLLVTRNGDYSNELKSYAMSEGVYNHVIFTGDVANPNVPISVCNVFIFPWLGKSGVGLALLEAMAWGKPVIVTDVGYGSEVIINGKNGLYVAPDAEQIAEKVDFLLRNREYSEELGRCAKRTVEERFSWEQVAEKYLMLYLDFDTWSK